MLCAVASSLITVEPVRLFALGLTIAADYGRARWSCCFATPGSLAPNKPFEQSIRRVWVVSVGAVEGGILQLNGATFDATNVGVVMTGIAVFLMRVALVWLGGIFYAMRKGLNELITGSPRLTQRLTRLKCLAIDERQSTDIASRGVIAVRSSIRWSRGAAQVMRAGVGQNQGAAGSSPVIHA